MKRSVVIALLLGALVLAACGQKSGVHLAAGRNSGSSGAAVQDVSSGTPAASAGIKSGDTIISIGGKPVSSATDVRSVLNLYHPGDRVAIAWVDTGGQRHQSNVKMVVGPPA